MFLFPCGVFALLLFYTSFIQFKSHLIQKPPQPFMSSLTTAGGSLLMPLNSEHRSLPSILDIQPKMASFSLSSAFLGQGKCSHEQGVVSSFYRHKDPQLGKVKSSDKHFLVLP